MTSAEVVLETQPACRVIVTVLFELDRQMNAAETLIADVSMPDALHDYRIAMRKTRTLLAQMDQMIAEPQLSKFKRGFADLMQRTGPLRDLQVCASNSYLSDPGNPASDLLLQSVLRQQRKVRNSLVRYLSSATHLRFRQSWQECLQQTATTTFDSGLSNDPATYVAGKWIQQAYRITVRQACKVGKRETTSSLHKLRKNCKDLRYLLEMFSDVYAGKACTDLCAELKKVQSKLGRMQDMQVLYQLLITSVKLLDERPDRPQRKQIKQLLRLIRKDRRKVKMNAIRMVRKYPQRTSRIISQLPRG